MSDLSNTQVKQKNKNLRQKKILKKKVTKILIFRCFMEELEYQYWRYILEEKLTGDEDEEEYRKLRWGLNYKNTEFKKFMNEGEEWYKNNVKKLEKVKTKYIGFMSFCPIYLKSYVIIKKRTSRIKKIDEKILYIFL